MRRPVDADRIRAFMAALGRAAHSEQTVYLVGGATAVLEGWRGTTIAVDITLGDGEAADELLHAIPAIKDELELNVELASPADFVPVPAGWKERSGSVAREGEVTASTRRSSQSSTAIRPSTPGASGDGWRRSRASAERRDQDRAGHDEQCSRDDAAADPLRPAEEPGGERNTEQRLGRDDRGHDRDRAAVEGLEQRDVGEADERAVDEPARDERLRPDDALPGPGHDRRGDHEARREHHGTGRHRGDVAVEGQMANEVVAQGKERRAEERKRDAETTNVLRTLRLERQSDPAAHDEERAEEHRGVRPFVEGDDRDRHREERRGPERDRRTRGAGLADPQRDEDVREPRRDRAREEKRGDARERHASLHDGRGAEHRERRDLHEERADGGRYERRAEREADGDRHRSEERGRDKREEDSVHQPARAETRRRNVAAAAGSARTIPASITTQPVHPAQPSRSERSSTSKSAANGASTVKTSAARAAVVRDCTQVDTRYPRAPAKTPVTTSAYHIAASGGASSCSAATATSANPANATAICRIVSARAS